MIANFIILATKTAIMVTTMVTKMMTKFKKLVTKMKTLNKEWLLKWWPKPELMTKTESVTKIIELVTNSIILLTKKQ